MPTKQSKYKQSLFDITSQNFGTLDNLSNVVRDNLISLSDNLTTGTSLIIDNTDLGEADIKQEISDAEKTFNNNYATAFQGWILADGFWNDLGTWIDTETWND